MKRKKNDLGKYTVHFEGFYGYDIQVIADTETDARLMAQDIFEETDANEFLFTNNGVEVFEED